MALRALSVAAALATAVAGVLWLCGGGALFLSVALALPATENWLPGAAVTRAAVTIPFAGGTLRADLYRPARPRGAILLVHGLSPAGRRQPDLARRARLLARHESPVAVAGFSFGAGPALLATPERPGIRLAGSFGGYADLRSVIAFITTSEGAEPYNRWKLLRLLAGFVGDECDRGGLDVIAQAKLANPFEDTGRLELALGADGQAVLALVHNRRAEAVSQLLASLSPTTHAALDRLSPLPVMARLRGRALIAHGRADTSIPYTESLRLANAAGTHAIVLDTFHHTGPFSPLERVGYGARDAWRLLSLADALLRAREP